METVNIRGLARFVCLSSIQIETDGGMGVRTLDRNETSPPPPLLGEDLTNVALEVGLGEQ